MSDTTHDAAENAAQHTAAGDPRLLEVQPAESPHFPGPQGVINRGFAMGPREVERPRRQSDQCCG